MQPSGNVIDVENFLVIEVGDGILAVVVLTAGTSALDNGVMGDANSLNEN